MSLLSVEHLSIHAGDKPLVTDLSLTIAPGERVGLIRESGSGKSLTAMAITGLLPANIVPSGSILFDGQQVIGASEHDLGRLRGNAATVIFQEPLTALDPLMRLGCQIEEPLRQRYRREGRDPAKIKSEVLELMERVALPQPERIAAAYPHEVSGGQRQRIAIARAIVARPELVLADEAVSALDLSTRIRIVDLLKTLEQSMTLVLVSHDLGVVASLCEDIVILERGRIMESGKTSQILAAPKHPYTIKLIQSAPRMPRQTHFWKTANESRLRRDDHRLAGPPPRPDDRRRRLVKVIAENGHGPGHSWRHEGL